MKKKWIFAMSRGKTWLQEILFTMGRITFFILAGTMLLSAKGFPQNETVSIKMKNATLIKVFKEITEQSGYDFLYNYDLIKGESRVNVEALNVEVKELLQEILTPRGFAYEFKENLIVIRLAPKVAAQDSTKKEPILIKGVVVDEKGVFLPGVTVLVKGTTLGVATDDKGAFRIPIPRDTATLIFTFIGMQTQNVKINALKEGEVRKDLKIVMKEDKVALEDVVVTGYSNIRKESFTGNVTTVNREQLLRTNSKNMLAAVQTFDPSFRIRQSAWGSDPNSLPEINIRGESSIGMNKSLESEYMKQTQRTNLKDNPNLPVFILDGFEVDVQKIYDMDMNRVESITILKDAAATAMYGSRAANGVMVITTVAPQPGEMRVTYNFTGGLELPDLSDYNLCNAAEKLEVERLAGVYTASSPSSQPNSDQDYYNKLNQVLKGVDTDWLAQPLHNVFNHKHTIYIEGGVESIRYGVDFFYDKNGGAMKGSYRDRVGAGMSLDYRYKKLQIRNYISYAGTRSENSPYGLFSTYASQQPYLEIYDEDGEYLKYLKDGIGTKANPLFDVTLGGFDGRTRYHEFQDNLNVNLFILEGLQFKGQLSITKTTQKQESFIDPKSVYAYRNSGSYNENERGELTQSYSDSYSWNLNAMFYYNRAIEKHFINATLGINIKEDNSNSHTSVFKGFQMEGMYNPSYAKSQPDKTSVDESTNRLIGFLASINYSYNDVYLFDGSIRLDGSSQFGSDKRYAPFWSVGAGINIHNYSWLRDNWLLSRLRLRASYGSTGKVNFPAYTAVSTYEVDSEHWYYTGPATSLKYLGNPKLKWETTKTTDVGFELGFLNDRILLSANYYIKKTVDLIDQISIRPSSGFSEYRDNSGSVENKGFEIDLSATLYRDKDWIVSFMGNMGGNKNKITKLGAAAEAYNEAINEAYQNGSSYYTQYAPFTRYYKGASTTAIYAVRSAGIDPANGKEKYIKRDGSSTYTWDSNDQVVVGDELPDVQGSFGLNVNFRGIYMNATFSYQWGGQVYNTTLMNRVENPNIQSVNVDKRLLTERWKKPGDITPYRNLQNSASTQPTSRFVQDENVLEFTSLSVGYDFKKELISKWRLTALGLRFNVNELARWSTVKVERGTNYPYAWNYSFTLNVSF
ncbi:MULTISPECIES: SusC/RagA family TonB-linked outer membrane protein [Porphyromonadaceae]|nr:MULTISPECIES: SusC/RagA family TonB-linked outer membrane protein [Porphyromonadaceae]PXZ42957.1 SusC/RagA family TonB-linked outer membrane protein [Sanguibacteroides justesenii]